MRQLFRVMVLQSWEGRPGVYYQLTLLGLEKLTSIQEKNRSLWDQVPISLVKDFNFFYAYNQENWGFIQENINGQSG